MYLCNLIVFTMTIYLICHHSSKFLSCVQRQCIFSERIRDYILEIPDPTGDIDIEHSISNFSYCKLIFIIITNYIFNTIIYKCR